MKNDSIESNPIQRIHSPDRSGRVKHRKVFSYLNRSRLRALFIFGIGLAWLVVVLNSYYFQLWMLILERNWPVLSLNLDPGFPFMQEALLRSVSGIVGAGVLMVSAAAVGRSIFRLADLEFERWIENLIFSTSIGIGIYAFTGLGLAAFGLYKPVILAFLAVVPAALWIGSWLISNRKVPPLHLDAWKKNFSRNKVWIMGSLLALGFAFIAALAPEKEYDALWYHLYYPRLYLEQGRLVDLPYDYVSLYPMTWELWFGYGLALGGQISAKLLHFAMLPMTGLVVYEMTRRFGSRSSPWMAVAIFTTVPTVLWEASTAYIDLALAFNTASFVYALLKFGESRKILWFDLAAFNLGMVVASKHLGLFVLLIGVVGLFLNIWKADRSLASALGLAALLAILGMLPALPWYGRAFIATGNPVFPEFYGIFGAPPERWDAVTKAGLQQFLDQFGRPLTLTNFLTLPWHMTIHGAAYHGTLGPVFLIFTPFLFLRRLRGPLVYLLGFSGLYLLLWASPFSSFQMRFLVPLTPFFAVLAAAGFRRFSSAARVGIGSKGPVLMSAGLTILLVLNLPPFTFLHERDRVGWEGWLNHVLHGVELGVVVGSESQHDYLLRKVRSYGVWVFAENNLPDEAVILSWTGGDQFYTHKSRIWAYAAAARPAVRADPGDTDLILAELNALGITHMIADDEYRNRLEAASSGTPEWLEILYDERSYSLYRILWEEETPNSFLDEYKKGWILR